MAPFDKKQLRGEVSALSWFHRIDLGHGVTTPGIDNTPSKIRKMHIPKRLERKTVIDIGAWNGAYSFECERRGAKRVLATDWYCWQGEGKQGFDLAKRVLGSRVEEREILVEDISRETVGAFDLVLFQYDHNRMVFHAYV